MTSDNPDDTSRPAQEGRIPSREEILQFVRESPGNIGQREIARAFGIRGSNRSSLRALLKQMTEAGEISRGRGKRIALAGPLPPVLVVEARAIDADGDVIAAPANWREDEEPPTILIVTKAQRRNQPAIGVGDRALVRVRETGERRYEAEVIRALGKTASRIVGVYRRDQTRGKESGGRVLATAGRGKDRREYDVSEGDRGKARDGDLVIAEIDARSRSRIGLPKARIIEVLGAFDAPGAVGTLVVATHDIPHIFPTLALEQAKAAGAPTLRGRVDLREIPLVTIDDEDARDFDDAVWAELDPEPGNPNGWHLIVAIADVAHYVRPDDPIDREALKRGNSVYLPDRVVPMLPEALSNGWCSLKPDEDRACMAVHMRIDKDGKMLSSRVERGLMRSAARLTYREVQAIADGPESGALKMLNKLVAPLYGAYDALTKARRARGALEIDRPERRVLLGEDGTVIDIVTRARFASHRLIEMFMIAANVAVGEILVARGAPCVFRIHDQPPLDRIESLRDYLMSLGYTLSRRRQMVPENFNQILRKAKDRPEEEAITLEVLRTQSQAEYNPDNIGHFGLSLPVYAHFTSPIRRYADLLVHRALIRVLGLGAGGLPTAVDSELGEIARAISATERRATIAERDAVDRFSTHYFSEHVGATLPARIVGVTRFGLFVTVAESGAQGLLPMRELGGDRYRHDEARRRLVGERSGAIFTMGAPLKVKLVEADAVTGALRFELADPPTVKAPQAAKRGAAAKARKKGHKAKSRAGRRRTR